MSWIVLLGNEGHALEQDLKRRLDDRIAGKLAAPTVQGKPTAEEVRYVTELELKIPAAGNHLNEQDHALLRALCRLSNVELLPFSISSHRRFVGPIIIKVKRLIFRFLQVLLRDVLRQQREFNMRAVEMISVLSRK